MPGVFRKKSTRRASRKVSKKRMMRKPSVSFDNRVLKVIRKQTETKTVSFIQPITAYNGAITINTDLSRIIPQVLQGTDSDQRIGDEIRLQSVTIRGHLIMSQSATFSAANTRLGVRMMCVTSKRYPHFSDAQANVATWLPSLMKIGPTEIGFDGQIQTYQAEMNTQQVTTHFDKRFYMTSPLRTVTTAIGQTETDVSTHSTKFFTIKLRCKNRKVTFRDGATYGYGFEPMITLGYCHLDGSAADTVETQVSMAYTVIVKYEDA